MSTKKELNKFMENKTYRKRSGGEDKMAVNDWVEVVYSSNESYIGQTVKVKDVNGENIRVATDDGEEFWTDSENLEPC